MNNAVLNLSSAVSTPPGPRHVAPAINQGPTGPVTEPLLQHAPTDTGGLNTVPIDARTVNTSGSEQTLLSPPRVSSFDFCFVKSDQDVRHLLTTATNKGQRDVILLSHPDDLARDSLLCRLHINDSGQPQLLAGKLLVSDVPLTLVLDIRALSGALLPRFNDLLDPDNPCVYDKISGQKQPLGSHVHCQVVASAKQLMLRSVDIPDCDFWRRINRPDNSLLYNVQEQDPDDCPGLLPEYPVDGDHTKTITIDCHLHHDWRRLLFGGPGINDAGRICHIPGRLEALHDGQTVILKGADWTDLAFEQSIRLLLANRSFVSNGHARNLPDTIRFFRSPQPERALSELLPCLIPVGTVKQPLVINQANLTAWLSDIRVNQQGFAEPNTSLKESIRAGSTVTVTSALDETSWLQLLGALLRIHREAATKPAVCLAEHQGQPKAVQDTPWPPANICPDQPEPLHVITYQQEDQPDTWLATVSADPRPLSVQIHSQTTFAQLFATLFVTSEQQPRFGCLSSPLLAALNSGRMVIMRGLDSNPTLAQLLEPLCCGQPLLINGVLHHFANAHITLLWPAAAVCHSPLWQPLVSSATSCPTVDIWQSTANHFGIDRTTLPEQAIGELYQAFATTSNGLAPLPPLSTRLLSNLFHAAHQAKVQDQVTELSPAHWRTAINSVLLHGTRIHQQIHDFLKFACEQLLPDEAIWVDRDRLINALNNMQPLDTASLQDERVWPLLRAFHPGVFGHDGGNSIQLSFTNPSPPLKQLSTLIAVHAPEQLQGAIAAQLQITLKQTWKRRKLPDKSNNRIKRVTDALSAGWQLSGHSSRSARINVLARHCLNIADDSRLPEPEARQQIATLLKEHLTWTGSGPAPLASLADDLYHARTGQKDRELRRLQRLKARLAHAPVIFVQGETGTGKSHFSTLMAEYSGKAFVVSVGPDASETSLIKRWVWREGLDSDRFMVPSEEIVLRWIRTQPAKKDDYVTLVLDEANLARPDLLTLFKGLWQDPPCIYCGGHPVNVSRQHRVILTGNPEHYSGRRLDASLKALMQQVHYPALDQAFLQDRVIEPALAGNLRPYMSDAQADILIPACSKSILALWYCYPPLLPEHQFTPRDLTDICAWIGWYLHQARATAIITEAQANALVLSSFADVLDCQLRPDQSNAHQAMKIWFTVHFPTDDTLLDRVNDTLAPINDNFRSIASRSHPMFDTSVAAVTELVRQLMQDLSRCQQAYQRTIKHGGRQATLIEGPAGRGKDVTLQLLINSFCNQTDQPMPRVHTLNAGDCALSVLSQTLTQAQLNGGIVVVSELNLVSSEYLEERLNSALTGNAHPGFHLFATVNPPGYSGRKPLSPALKGRFRCIPIREYNQQELASIAQKAMPSGGRQAADTLSYWHWLVRRELQRQRRHLQPSSLDLQRLARDVSCGDDFSENAIIPHFFRHYRLYLAPLGSTIEQLQQTSGEQFPIACIDRELCQWLSATVSDKRPWLVQLVPSTNSATIATERHIISIPLGLTDPGQEVVKLLARARWAASRLPADPPEAEDTLVQTLYRQWQHAWFDHHFARTGIRADQVFRLTEAQQLTMTMEENQPYLAEARQLVNSKLTSTINLWPTLWRALCENLNYPVCSFDHCPAPESLAPPEPQAPPEPLSTCEPEAEVTASQRIRFPDTETCIVPKNTDYSVSAPPVVWEKKIFAGNHDARMYRLSVCDISVNADGVIQQQTYAFGQYGFEAVIPATTWPEQGPITLAPDQTLAEETFWYSANQWLELPSLMPEETITALRTTPSVAYQLIKDRYTGLHLIHFPQCADDRLVTITYVVQTIRKTSFPRNERLVGAVLQNNSSERPDACCAAPIKAAIDQLFSDECMATLPPSQQRQLRAMSKASSDGQLLTEIKNYCGEFSGTSRATESEPLLFFLLRSRQGACLHRTITFVALCRYFGIPARVVMNRLHSFPECSLNNGLNWHGFELGGGPVTVMKVLTEHPPVKKGLATPPCRLTTRLQQAPPGQRAAYARAMGVAIDDLEHALNHNLPLPDSQSTQPSTNGQVGPGKKNIALIQALWQTLEPDAFAMGMDLLITSDDLSQDEIRLAGDCHGKTDCLKDVVTALMIDNHDIGLITVKLEELYQRLFHDGSQKMPRQDWLYTVLNIFDHLLIDSDSDSLFRTLKCFPAFTAHLQHLVTLYDLLAIPPFPYTCTLYPSDRISPYRVNPPGTNATSVRTVRQIIHGFLRTDRSQSGSENYQLFSPTTDIDTIKTIQNAINKKGNTKGQSSSHRARKVGVFATYCHEYLDYHFSARCAQLTSQQRDATYRRKITPLARHALESGWLDPQTEALHITDCDLFGMRYLQLLQAMTNIDGLKALASTRLRQWYKCHMSRDRGNILAGSLLPVTLPSIGGRSQRLETIIKIPTRSSAWTYEPEGVPDIERLLTHNPAFNASGSGNTAHRPAIIVSLPGWDYPNNKNKLSSLLLKLQQQHPEIRTILTGVNGYKLRCHFLQSIKEAFSNYLFATARAHGGRLVICWMDATIVTYDHDEEMINGIKNIEQTARHTSYGRYGSHEPTSPEDLHKLLSAITNDLNLIDDEYILPTHHADNGIVLRDDMTVIVGEFIDTIDVHLLYQALRQRCPVINAQH